MIDGKLVDMTFLGSPFRNQHTIIRARLADVMESAAGGNGYDLSVLFERLALALRSHLLMEDNVVYPALTSSRDAALRARALELREAGGDQARRFEAFYAKWGDRKLVNGDVAAFARDLEEFASMLLARMDAEDAQIYSRLGTGRPKAASA